MPPELNGRVDFWNIGYPLGAVIYLSSLIAVAAVAWAVYQRSKIWRLGVRNTDVGPWGPRLVAGLRTLLVDSVAHRRFTQRVYGLEQYAQEPNWDGLTNNFTGVPYQDQAFRETWGTERENLFGYLR